MTRPGGFTLAEAVVAMVLSGLVGSTVVQLLVAHQRLSGSQHQRVAVTESARIALSFIPGELRELSPPEGDLIALGLGALTYKSMRSLYLTCAAPDPGSLALILDREAVSGLYAISPADDSVLVFAENDPATRADDAWISAGIAAATDGSTCPAGRPSVTVDLAGNEAARLAGVTAGAPVRTFQAAQLLLYRDGNGDWWLGERAHQPASGTWSITQAILGPLATSGLEFTYEDTSGAATLTPTQVARIGIRVEGRSPRAVYGAGGLSPLEYGLATHVAVRNSPWY